MEYDGTLISELGVKKYLHAYEAQKFSNVKLLYTREELQQAFRDCDFSCHYPGYRSVKRT